MQVEPAALPDVLVDGWQEVVQQQQAQALVPACKEMNRVRRAVR